MVDTKILLRVPEAAEATGLSRSRIYELIAEGAIPVRKIGASTRILRRDLEEWAEKLGQQDRGND
jgi:excisionase family DNA binding protein